MADPSNNINTTIRVTFGTASCDTQCYNITLEDEEFENKFFAVYVLEDNGSILPIFPNRVMITIKRIMDVTTVEIDDRSNTTVKNLCKSTTTTGIEGTPTCKLTLYY